MKKTTLLRKTAYLVPPQIADGFVPPANFDYKISVSLHEVDIKIYGFTGTSWELMYNSDGVLASFEAEVQHQKYYFESKTGEEQIVRVSFLSTENAAGTGIRTGVTPETRRFYDIEEIPVYNGSRDGAMLTVMSDGSLAWLLANEPFVIPAVGGGNVSYPVVNSMITDSSRFSTYYGATITPEDTLKLSNHTSSMLRTTAQSMDNSIQEDTTITMWVKSSSTQTTASILRFGTWSSADLAKGVYVSMSTRLGMAKTVAGNAIMSSYSNGYFIIKTNNDAHNGSNSWRYKTYFAIPKDIRDGEWHQLVFQFLNVGAGVGDGTAKVYVDGVKINDSFRDNGNIEQDANGLQVLSHNPINTVRNGYLTLGAGFGVDSEFGGFTIEEQVLTEEQIESKYADDGSNYTP
tara:strand:- start:2164 stop:3375 length:1212 start_codon:yes stop_codon:yes gene_type:complete